MHVQVPLPILCAAFCTPQSPRDNLQRLYLAVPRLLVSCSCVAGCLVRQQVGIAIFVVPVPDERAPARRNHQTSNLAAVGVLFKICCSGTVHLMPACFAWQLLPQVERSLLAQHLLTCICDTSQLLSRSLLMCHAHACVQLCHKHRCKQLCHHKQFD